MNKSCLYLIFASLIITSCIDPYPPPVIDTEINYLVVDGSINSDAGTAHITLSRAVPLSSTEPSPREKNATVSVEDNDGNIFLLTESGNGVYEHASLPVDNTKQYRLHIKTTDNTVYRSDFIAIKPTPAIDSLTWAPNNDRSGIEISVTTHDDTRQTRYYQWSFEETYEYQAAFHSSYKIEEDTVILLPQNERTYVCWRTLTSQNILIGSTERLNEDVIYKQPLALIPKNSQKLIIKYSILVKQRSLSREAYDYWLNLQKTTENLGGLFDPQPGSVRGNVYNVSDPDDPVLGYFDAGAVTEKRLFISAVDLPADLRNYKDIGFCLMDTVLVDDVLQLDRVSNRIVTTIYVGPDLIGYYFTSSPCADCRFEKGTTTKPAFWQ